MTLQRIWVVPPKALRHIFPRIVSCSRVLVACVLGLLGVCGFCFLVLPRFSGKLMFNVREATLTIRAWLDREPVATLGCEPIVILVLVCTAHPELLGAIGAWMLQGIYGCQSRCSFRAAGWPYSLFLCAWVVGVCPPTNKQKKILNNK